MKKIVFRPFLGVALLHRTLMISSVLDVVGMDCPHPVLGSWSRDREQPGRIPVENNFLLTGTFEEAASCELNVVVGVKMLSYFGLN